MAVVSCIALVGLFHVSGLKCIRLEYGEDGAFYVTELSKYVRQAE